MVHKRTNLKSVFPAQISLLISKLTEALLGGFYRYLSTCLTQNLHFPFLSGPSSWAPSISVNGTSFYSLSKSEMWETSLTVPSPLHFLTCVQPLTPIHLSASSELPCSSGPHQLSPGLLQQCPTWSLCYQSCHLSLTPFCTPLPDDIYKITPVRTLHCFKIF